MKSKTAVWYPAKKALIEGPSFPSTSFQALYPENVCSISLNKTHVIIMGHQSWINKYTDEYKSKVAMVDFQKQEWFYLTDIYVDLHVDTCKGALGFDKHGKRLVIHFSVSYPNFKFGNQIINLL